MPMRFSDPAWVTSAEFKNVTDFYTSVMTGHPSGIIQDDLREGLEKEPEVWTPKLMNSVVEMMVAGFQDSRVWVGLSFTDTGAVAAMVRAHLDAPRATILDLMVAEPYRGRGLGSRMLHWAEKELREAGALTFQVSCANTNKDGRGFLTAMGYCTKVVLMTREFPAPPPVRFDCGGHGGTSEFSEGPVSVTKLKKELAKKVTPKKGSVRKPTTKSHVNKLLAKPQVQKAQAKKPVVKKGKTK